MLPMCTIFCDALQILTALFFLIAINSLTRNALINALIRQLWYFTLQSCVHVCLSLGDPDVWNITSELFIGPI